MLGMLCRQARGRVRVEKIRVAGVRVLCAYVSRDKQLARAARLLRRAGVRRILEPVGWRPELPGLPVVDALPLYRAVADRLVLEQLDVRGIAPERASVVLRGACPDGELTAAAYALCPQVRQVIVDTERGGEELQRSLLRRFGAAVLPVKDERDALAVRFSGTYAGEELSLCGQGVLGGLSLDVPQLVLPEELVRASVLCALWQAGVLDLSQVQVCRREAENKFT